MCCVHFLKEKCTSIDGFFVDYGQPAAIEENIASTKLATKMGIHLQRANTQSVTKLHTGEITARNMMLVSTALTFGSRASGLIVLGVHSGTEYYDCSPAFIGDLDNLVRSQTNGAFSVFAPFISWAKHDIFTYALKNELPIESVYSCEAGGVGGCGECLSCRDRAALQALQKSGQY